jgi:phospholipase C
VRDNGPILSRRAFLAGAASASALLALDACSSGSNSARHTSTSRAAAATSAPPATTSPLLRVRRAGERPDPSRPEGTKLIDEIDHIVVVMQENHSYDCYFGMLGRGDGFTLDVSGQPTAVNTDARGTPVRAFHQPNTCQPHPVSQNWHSMHTQWNGGAMDGFARSPSGTAAMGYWTEHDIPFYYSLARTFPVCDRWFASTFGQTFPNRRFLLCGSALGTTRTDITDRPPAPKHGTIVEALGRNHIDWRDYHHDLASLLLFFDVYTANADKCPPLEQFFRDAAAGSLPAFSLVEPNSVTTTEENPQDLSLGEAFTASVLDAVMRSPAWPKTVLVFCYDEHGGYYDHVPPPVAVLPDDIAPQLAPGAGPPNDYGRYGFRVPAVIVSPYSRRDYVSHVVHDHTSILSLVEHTWNLPALSDRDGAADALLDCLDFNARPFLTPPTLAAPANTTGKPQCAVPASS